MVGAPALHHIGAQTLPRGLKLLPTIPQNKSIFSKAQIPLKASLTTEEDIPLSESLYSNCIDTPVESWSDEEKSMGYLPVASSFGFQKVENGDLSSEEDLEEQSVPRIWKKRYVLQRMFQCFH
ncbi:hypothetical protein NPIL_552341 [Nephila pilipes]|uniref:Uncharacterized protein n=1 Tax=Nephila pilipes TaxID=299642 RepID=A0A8X6Q537_NEPPI|nr:hypothetical protein NPIL_552341 [Nephila pilipes]